MADVVVVFRAGPADALRVRDGLDLALAALAFDHDVRVVFTGAGAALLHATDPVLAANLRALAYHGVAAVGVERDGESPGPGELVLDAQRLDASAVRAWLDSADHVLWC